MRSSAKTRACLAGALLALAPPSAGLAQVITEFHIGRSAVGLIGITAGPDDTLWFSESAAHKIGVLSTDGALLAEYDVTGSPGPIVQDAGSSLWFTECDVNFISRLTTPRVFLDEFTVGAGIYLLDPTCAPQALVIGTGLGMTNDMWFTESFSRLGRFDATHQHLDHYSILGHAHALTLGPDEALWFTEDFADKIGRLDPLFPFTPTDFPLPPHSGPITPNDITTGPDRALWFSEYRAERIGRITLDGSVTEFSVSSGPGAIVTGPDGNLWFLESPANVVARMSPSGALAEFPIPTTGSQPAGIAVGPDGNIWFTEHAADTTGLGDVIARVQIQTPPTSTPTPTETPHPTGTATHTRSPTDTPTPGLCYGDCNSDGRVTIDELVNGVHIALGNTALESCPALDCDDTARITVECLVKAVNAAIHRCNAAARASSSFK